MRSIAIDGPSGSGKSTIAGHLARRLNMLHLDTGAMYRALAYLAKMKEISWEDEAGITGLLQQMDFQIRNGALLLNGHALPSEIRAQEFAAAASRISAIPEVRSGMQKIQRRLAGEFPLIMDGRDIGTCVIPDTPYKFYLDAKVEERARRRYEQGDKEHYSFDEVLCSLKERDAKDMNRSIAPLRIAEGAIVVDTTNLSIEETVETLISLMEDVQ